MIIRIFASSVPTKPLNDAQMRGAFLYIYVYSQNTLMERLTYTIKSFQPKGDILVYGNPSSWSILLICELSVHH